MDHGGARDVQMALMGRIERSAEQSDSDAMPVPEAWDRCRL
jgi:hypothetical protein